MTTITVRVVKTRDAATSVLRKLGLKPNAYGLFMKKLEDGRWEIDLPKVHEQGYAVSTTGKAPKAAKPAKAKTAKKVAATKSVKEPKAPKTPKAPKERRVSVSSVAEALILAGKTNEEVFAELKAQFKLDDAKKSYPSWYRCRLKRQGKTAVEK